MKNFIHKINQYLLKNYPTIWNTRIVWVLTISLLAHLLFFIIGFVIMMNPNILTNDDAKDLFTDAGLMPFGMIISLLIIVGWLVFMFKNNAFKNYYPFSRNQLFFQFISYLVIIFVSTTFYFSYNFGLKCYISMKYDDKEFHRQVTLANKVAPFLSHSLDYYTLDNKRFPKIFDSLYCETNSELIDVNEPNFTFGTLHYQFYTLKSIVKPKDSIFTFNGIVQTQETDSTNIYFFKDKVFDISKYITSSEPSYYNFSNLFFENSDEPINYLYNEGAIDGTYDKTKVFVTNKEITELLNRNNPNEIKGLLQNYLQQLDYYGIKHNLNTEKWFQLVYFPKNFTFNNIIRTQDPNTNNHQNNYDETVVQEVYNIDSTANDEENTKYQTFKNKFYDDHITNYYIESQDFKNALDNLKYFREKNVINETLHFFLWFAFILATIIFIFRTSGLQSLIFSIVASGVLSVVLSLLAVLIGFSLREFQSSIYIMMIIYLCIGFAILLFAFFGFNFKKLIHSIFINLSLAGFVLLLLLIFIIINQMQEDSCRAQFPNYHRIDKCKTIMDYLGETISYILFVVAIIFNYFFFTIVRKWKAKPEN